MSIYIPCAYTSFIIPVRKPQDNNEFIELSWHKPDKQNVQRTEQKSTRSATKSDFSDFGA